ncbi:MAG: hypothetical protein AAGC78_15490 [Cellvibrio sp.]|uniref:hypothetical protein n=1 Tax=Cellvibrio sp. TaxID=1965322 RepID=UPI0031A500DD
MADLQTKTHLYELLGQIVVSFGALERGVDGLILGAMDSPFSQGQALLKSMSFQQKVPAMGDLIRNMHSVSELGVLSQTLQALIERCDACEQERNNWVCSYWVPEVNSPAGFVSRLSHSNDSGALVLALVDISELERCVVVLNATVAYLYGFHQKLSNNFRRVRSIRLVEEFLNASQRVAQN